MIIKTTTQQLVKAWQEQEIWVEVENIEEFEQHKKKNTLDSIAIDWGDSEIFWDTVEYIDEDCKHSVIMEEE